VFLPALLFAGFLLPFAALLATRWRFALLPAALVSLLTVTFLFLQPHNLYVLTHVQPEFSLLVPMMALGLVAGVARVWGTVEIYRDDRDEHRAPRYLGHSLSGLAGIVIGMVLVALLVSSAPQTAGVSVGPHGEPTTHMTPSAFVPNVVLVPIGLSLQIVADSSAKHILANGRWDANGIPHPLVEPGAPALHDMAMTGGGKGVRAVTLP